MIAAIDTETTGTDFFHGCRPYLILSCDGETNHHWAGEVNPFTRDVYWDDDVLAEVQEYIDSLETAIFHNGMFDIRALESIGIDCSRLWWISEDTLLASHVVCSGDVHGLKDISEKYFGWENEEEEHLKTIVMQKIAEARAKGYAVAKEGHSHFPGLKGATVKWYKMDYWLAKDEVLRYGFGDVERTFLFWKVFKESMIQDGLWDQYQTRKKLLRICYDVQTVGKNLYVDKAKELITHNRQRMEECRLAIKKELSITYKLDLNKKDHLFDVIHTRCKIAVHHYTKGSTEQRMVPAMDKNAIDYYLEQSKHPALVLFKEYRKLQTRTNYVQGYLDWVDKDGRIHSNLNPTGTRETRQSSSSPNDQNIDSFLKTLFGPPPGKVWLSIDMVNIELRIWAYSVGNKELIDAFEKGLSVHAMIMELLFPEEYEIYIVAKKKHKSQLTQGDLHALKQYGWVKNGNFARIYGATDKKTNQT
jgi:DNA polymerase I-like protein with 3'-5' exonuclease and polymerase domains